MGADGLYRLSDTQAQEILQMRLQRLTGLEQDKIVAEYKEVMAEIDDLLDILAKPERVSTIIGDELATLKQEFGQTKLGARRSQVEHSAFDLSTEDLITPTDMVVTLSHSGYIKSQPLGEYRAQKRGGRGKQATATKEDDWIDQLFIANTHDYILCFSNRGRLYWLKVWEVPAGSRGSRGRPIVNMFPLQEGEKINVVLPLTGEKRSFPADHYVFMATSHGHGQEDRARRVQQPAQGRHHRGRPRPGRLPDRRRADRRHARRDAVLRRRQGGALRRERRAPDGPQCARRARHDAGRRPGRDRHAGGRRRSSRAC